MKIIIFESVLYNDSQKYLKHLNWIIYFKYLHYEYL